MANRALEDLRAKKVIASSTEAELRLTVPPAWIARLEPFKDELAGFLLVAAAMLVHGDEDTPPEAAARRTDLAKCQRCWTYRADVRRDGPSAGLCARCEAVLAATGRTVGG